LALVLQAQGAPMVATIAVYGMGNHFHD